MAADQDLHAFDDHYVHSLFQMDIVDSAAAAAGGVEPFSPARHRHCRPFAVETTSAALLEPKPTVSSRVHRRAKRKKSKGAPKRPLRYAKEEEVFTGFWPSPLASG